jgi:hypothetical protein
MKSVFQATDIYSAVWLLHFVSTIFGFAPYSLKPGSQSGTYVTIFTCFSRMWSIFCIILLVALQYIYTTGNIKASVTLKQKAREVMCTTSLYSYSIINIFLSLTINHGKVPQILQKFSEIDQLFSSKTYRIQIYKNTRLFLTMQFAIMISTFVTIYSYSAAYVIKDNVNFMIISFLFISSMPLILNCTAILHFVNLVLLLRNKYKHLNSELENSALTPRNVTNLNYRNMNSMTPIENYTSTMKRSITKLRRNCISRRSQHLRNVKIIYSQLHDVALLINPT